MTDDCPRRLDLIVLARLATSSSPPSVNKLEQDLFVFAEARLSRREWSTCLARRLAELRTRAEIDDRRVPTTKGLGRLRDALGVQAIPERWSKIWRVLIPALALEVPGARWSEVSSPDKLRARLIRQEHQLSLRETPTLTQAVDAQAWRALGLEVSGALTLNKLRRALLEQSLDNSIRAKSVDAVEAGHWLATAAAGTTTRDIAAIRRSLVSRWLFDTEAAEVRDTSRETKATAPEPKRSPSRPASSEPASLERWAARVQAIAESTSSGRYGDERVFIASVWRAARTKPDVRTESLSEFKNRLAEANRAGLLRLHRADLVSDMDERLVHESELQYFNASFHFIEITPRSTR